MEQNDQWIHAMVGRDDVLHVMVPLTPSLNETMRWRSSFNIKKITNQQVEQGIAVRASLCQIRPRIKKPWAQKVKMHVVRCTNTTRKLDDTNLIGGLKTTEDAMVSAGIMPDDSPNHASWGRMEQRTRGHWYPLEGPATHIFVERIE